MKEIQKDDNYNVIIKCFGGYPKVPNSSKLKNNMNINEYIGIAEAEEKNYFSDMFASTYVYEIGETLD